MLVPAGVLVLFILGSIAVDAAVAFMAQREVSSLAAAAANDVAGASVSDPTFYGEGGRVVLDRAAAARVAEDARLARQAKGVRDVRWDVRVAGDQVCVTVTGTVDYIFAKAVPGAKTSHQVKGQAVATAVRGDAPAVKASPADLCP